MLRHSFFNYHTNVNWINAFGKDSSLITCRIVTSDSPTEENSERQWKKSSTTTANWILNHRIRHRSTPDRDSQEVQHLCNPAISSAIRVTQSHACVSPDWHTTQTLTLTNSEVRVLNTYSQQFMHKCSNHFLHEAAPSLLVHTMPVHGKAVWSEDENLTTNRLTRAQVFWSWLYTNWCH